MIPSKLAHWAKKVPGLEYLNDTWHFHVTKRDRNNATKLIKRHLRTSNPIVVQIGSNDGKSGDPIYPLFREAKDWRGLFVEPLPYLMERLRENYAFSENCQFECAAVNDGQPAVLYYVDPGIRLARPNLPEWSQQIASLRAKHIATIPEFSEIFWEYRKEVIVNGITFSGLLAKHGIEHFDLLHIDTEGYDWKILSQVDLIRYPAKIILFEHKCLEPEEKSEAVRHLSDFYALQDLGGDYFCLRLPEITR